MVAGMATLEDIHERIIEEVNALRDRFVFCNEQLQEEKVTRLISGLKTLQENPQTNVGRELDDSALISELKSANNKLRYRISHLEKVPIHYTFPITTRYSVSLKKKLKK